MIQRIQSLFLLASVLICVILIYIPVYEFIPQSEEAVAAMKGMEYKFTIFNSAILAIINGAIGALSLVAIFLFKNRNLQIRLANICLLLTCGLIGLLFFSADSTSSTLNAKVHYMYGSYLPVIMAVFLFLAVRYIKRDENLVRSADRLR